MPLIAETVSVRCERVGEYPNAQAWSGHAIVAAASQGNGVRADLGHVALESCTIFCSHVPKSF